MAYALRIRVKDLFASSNTPAQDAQRSIEFTVGGWNICAGHQRGIGWTAPMIAEVCDASTTHLHRVRFHINGRFYRLKRYLLQRNDAG